MPRFQKSCGGTPCTAVGKRQYRGWRCGVQHRKLPLTTPASHMDASSGPSCFTLDPVPANARGRAVEECSPCTHEGDPDEVLASAWPRLLAVVSLWGAEPVDGSS